MHRKEVVGVADLADDGVHARGHGRAARLTQERARLADERAGCGVPVDDDARPFHDELAGNEHHDGRCLLAFEEQRLTRGERSFRQTFGEDERVVRHPTIFARGIRRVGAQSGDHAEVVRSASDNVAPARPIGNVTIVNRTAAAGVRGILFTDVVGSSALRSRLGENRADDLRRDHDAILGAAVDDHGGVVLRWTGDGLKASFGSASAAISAAIAMQRAVARYGRKADAVAPFEIRVGISAGEVTDEDGDIHGVAVIEGARLEAMASPGEILVTDLVRGLGQRRVNAGFEEVGVHTLKGLDEPVRVLRVLFSASDEPARPVPRSLALDRRFPLVGREEAFASALRRWDEVRSGTAATVLVAGQPGIGKSRLLAQIAERVHADGALVLAGACDSDLAVPYQPFAVAFGEHPSTDDELASAVTTGGGPLGPLFPARRAGRFDDAGPAARFELFEAVVRLVDRLAHDQPVVLVLEDLQWATPPTVQLLRHLVRHATDVRMLILASYRVEDLPASEALQQLLADVHASTVVSKVDLGALQPADVVTLVTARVSDAPAERIEAFARRLCDESGGSPFFVCELLEHLSATRDLDGLIGHGGAELPIPDSLRDVVGQRLARLSDGAGDLLAVAAVVGQTFDLDLLTVLVDQSPEDVLAGLEDVARVGLAVEVDVGRFSFAHAIMRATLLDRMSATRRALAHRRVAEAIEALQRADYDELAHHWLQAGVEDKAFVNLELAARRDLEALAYESAAERYQVILDHYRALPAGDQATIGRAWLGLGLARRALGHGDHIVAIEEAGRLGRRLGDVDIVAEAAIASILPSTFFVTAGRTQTGLVELGEDALEMVDASDLRRVRILTTLAAHLTYDDDRDRRVALLQEALTLARRSGDPTLIGSVLVAEYLTLWDASTFARRADITAEVARMARASGDNDLEFFAGFFAAFGALERGQVAESRRHLEAVAGPVAASRNFYFGFLADRLKVSLDILTGRPGVQADIDALATRYAGTHADTSGTWALQTGGLALQSGRFGDFVPALRSMLEDSEIAENWRPPFGLALLANGDREEAMAVLDAVEEPPLDFFWLTTTQVIAELAVGLERTDVVARAFETLMPCREQVGVTASGSLCLGLVATTLGQLALALDDYDVAIELLGDAVARADAMDAPFERVKARRVLVAALHASGRRTGEITALLATADELAARHGFFGERRLLADLVVGHRR
jgi:class 3 adenylate cyclase/tetratricopeptide (TPR) repeat protein